MFAGASVPAPSSKEHSLPRLRCHTGFALTRLLSNPPLREIRQLRRRAWGAEGLWPPGCDESGRFIDPVDELAMHWTVEQDGQLVAAARVSFHAGVSELPDEDERHPELAVLGGPLASLNRLVVAPEYRSRGYGRQVSQACIDSARASGCSAIIAASHGRGLDVFRKLKFAFIRPARTRFLRLNGTVLWIEDGELLALRLTSSMSRLAPNE